MFRPHLQGHPITTRRFGLHPRHRWSSSGRSSVLQLLCDCHTTTMCAKLSSLTTSFGCGRRHHSRKSMYIHTLLDDASGFPTRELRYKSPDEYEQTFSFTFSQVRLQALPPHTPFPFLLKSSFTTQKAQYVPLPPLHPPSLHPRPRLTDLHLQTPIHRPRHRKPACRRHTLPRNHDSIRTRHQ